jgi:hypothetical protein
MKNPPEKPFVYDWFLISQTLEISTMQVVWSRADTLQGTNEAIIINYNEEENPY